MLPWTGTKFGQRGFCYADLAAWNSLPPDHDITGTRPNTFSKRLNSVHVFLIVLISDPCAALLNFA